VVLRGSNWAVHDGFRLVCLRSSGRQDVAGNRRSYRPVAIDRSALAPLALAAVLYDSPAQEAEVLNSVFVSLPRIGYESSSAFGVLNPKLDGNPGVRTKSHAGNELDEPVFDLAVRFRDMLTHTRTTGRNGRARYAPYYDLYQIPCWFGRQITVPTVRTLLGRLRLTAP